MTHITDPSQESVNTPEAEKTDDQQTPNASIETTSGFTEQVAKLPDVVDAQTQTEPMAQDPAPMESNSKPPMTKNARKKKKKITPPSGDPQGIDTVEGTKDELSSEPTKSTEVPSAPVATKVKENVPPALPNIKPPTGNSLTERILNAGAQLGENKAALNRPS